MVTVVSGARSRVKRLRIDDLAPAEAQRRLARWLGDGPGEGIGPAAG
jgi:uncharacterized protein YggU (UPF0235/DUF167 family)